MIDLDRELRALDDIPTPELGDNVQRREPGLSDEVRSPFVRGGTSALAVIATVMVICVVAGGLVWTAFTPREDAPPVTTPAPNTGDPLASIPEGWTDLPLPPLVAYGAATVWAGDRLIVWGGIEPRAEAPNEVLGDGWAFDPGSSRWTSIATGPIERSDARAVWTGEKVLIWGGAEGGGPLMDGAAYDPSTDTWTAIAAAPIAPRRPAVVEWTGTELFVWGGGDADAPYLDGAAYDPSNDSWRVVPDAPTEMNLADAAWTGRELVIVGSLLDNRNHAATASAQALAFDPTTDEWRHLAEPGLSPQSSAVAAVGSLVFAFDYSHDAVVLDSEADRWLGLADVPTTPAECYVDAASLDPSSSNDAGIFAWSCGNAALLDVSEGVWHVVATMQAPTEYVIGHRVVGADDVIFVLGHGVTEFQDETCRGCPDLTAIFRAYRPPVDFRDGALEDVRDKTRSWVAGFMRARIEGNDMLLTRLATEDGLARWGDPVSGLGPLTDVNYVGFTIRFVDGPLGYTGDFEVGVSIERSSGAPIDETLFLSAPPPGPATEPTIIVGARPGLDGP